MTWELSSLLMPTPPTLLRVPPVMFRLVNVAVTPFSTSMTRLPAVSCWIVAFSLVDEDSMVIPLGNERGGTDGQFVVRQAEGPAGREDDDRAVTSDGGAQRARTAVVGPVGSGGRGLLAVPQFSHHGRRRRRDASAPALNATTLTTATPIRARQRRSNSPRPLRSPLRTRSQTLTRERAPTR